LVELKQEFDNAPQKRLLADPPSSLELINGYIPHIDEEVIYVHEIYEQFIADNRVYFVNNQIEAKPQHR
jgi:hypothetical protein